MKSLKPFLLVLAGVLITVALFSFKTEGKEVEYAKFISAPFDRNFKLYYGDGETSVFQLNVTQKEWAEVAYKEEIKVLNKLAKEGWRYVGEINGVIYLERIKQ